MGQTAEHFRLDAAAKRGLVKPNRRQAKPSIIRKAQL